jgi:hypothetical protein
MTSPIILRQEGFGDAIQRGLQPLLQALQQRQQTQLQQQQLALQQQQVQAQVAASQADTERLRLQGEQRVQQLEDQSKAAKIFQQSFEQGEGKFSNAMIRDMLAQAKTPGQVEALLGMIPGIGEALSAPAEVRAAEVGAEAAEVTTERQRVALTQDERMARLTEMDVNLRTKAQRFANQLLESPDAALPADPNLREAVGLQMLELLPFINSTLEREASGATGGTAALIFARQQAMQSVSGATRAYAERLNLANADEIAGIPSPTSREGLTPFLAPGMDYETAETLIRAATDQALRTLGAERPGASSGFPEFDRIPDFQSMDDETKRRVIRVAQAHADGAELSHEMPTRTRALIMNLARRIRQKREQ